MSNREEFMSFDLEIIDGDLQIKADGSMRIVTDTPKLRQDLLKIVLTGLGSNKFHPWYGCSVTDSSIGSSYPDNLLFSDIQTSIMQSLDRLKTLQMSQASAQSVSLAEMIAQVEGVEVERNPADPRQINIRISIWTKRLTKIEEVFTIIS
jgi:phage baseplate assembly protein W